jgi:hypothetical protein
MSRWEWLKKRVHYLLNKLMWLLIIGLSMNTVFVLLFMYVEHRSFSDSMWWGWVTGFTVGYGDISPVSNAGRLVAIVAMATDFVLLACFSGQITAMVLINKDVYSEAEQSLSKHRNSIAEVIGREVLASNHRIEAALGCLPDDLPEIPPYRTDAEILASFERQEKS